MGTHGSSKTATAGSRGSRGCRGRVEALAQALSGAGTGLLGVIATAALTLIAMRLDGGTAAPTRTAALAALAATGVVGWVRQTLSGRLLRRLVAREESLEATQRSVTLALDHMSQGVCVFDASERLVTSNDCYARMYGIEPVRIVPGMSLGAVLVLRAAAGSVAASRGIEGYLQNHAREINAGVPVEKLVPLADGRFMLVKSCPLADGGWISTHTDVTAEKRGQDRMAFMARHDALTGARNRFAFYDELEAAVAAPDRVGRTVLLVDLDHFKSVNDLLGHAAGDTLLRHFVDGVTGCIGAMDVLARLGGDEFALLGGADENAAERLARSIIGVTERPFAIDGRSVVVGVSIGATRIEATDEDAQTVLSRADLALYAAKSRGGGYEIFTPQLAAAHTQRLEREKDLERAIEAGEFELHYQSQHEVVTGRLRGFEALVRWRHPTQGLLGPSEFIPLAEETGLILPLGRWVLERACRDASGWAGDLMVAVNVSAIQFRDAGLGSHILGVLKATALPAKRLELEITETALMQQMAETLLTLGDLRQSGVEVALDDFGTGYSSLSYLRHLPFDSIKIDRSFIRDVARSEEAQSIASTIVRLAHELGGRTIAEGVETQAQLAKLEALGCDLAQGFYFSRPMGPETMADYLARLGGAERTHPPTAAAARSEVALLEAQ